MSKSFQEERKVRQYKHVALATLWLTCVSIPQVVANRLLINGKAAKLEHMAALHVSAVPADTILHNFKLLLQRLLQ